MRIEDQETPILYSVLDLGLALETEKTKRDRSEEGSRFLKLYWGRALSKRGLLRAFFFFCQGSGDGFSDFHQ